MKSSSTVNVNIDNVNCDVKFVRWNYFLWLATFTIPRQKPQQSYVANVTILENGFTTTAIKLVERNMNQNERDI